MIKYLLNFMVLLLGAGLLLTGCQDAGVSSPGDRPVKVMEVSEPEAVLTRILPGRVEPVRESALSFRVSGQVEEISVKKGDHVGKGQVLARLDPRDYEIALRNVRGRLEQAQAELKALKTGARQEDVDSLQARLEAALMTLKEASLQHERYLRLYSMEAVARADLDAARTALEQARSRVRSLEMELAKARSGARQEDIEAMQARISSLRAGLDEARTALQYTVLKAPYSGYVADIFVDSHVNIPSGQSILLLQDVSALEVSFSVPEQIMVHRENIRKVEVKLDNYPEFYFPARFKEMTTKASPATGSYVMTVVMDQIDQVQIYPSMAGQVKLEIVNHGRGDCIMIPDTALVAGRNGQSMVWIYNPETSRVSSRQVSSRGFRGSSVCVRKGIEPGENIVTAGAPFLAEGLKVKPIRRN
ncbi:MAG: efflux RND transporter periplasmic adaptor subunit [Desulfonatronovibrionaceae bacterium]